MLTELDFFAVSLYNEYNTFIWQFLAKYHFISAILGDHMQATFHIKRERIQHFHMGRYSSLGGGLHFHSHIELLVVHQGQVEAWIGDAKETVGEHQLALATSYVPHVFQAEPNGLDCTILFIPPFLCPEFSEAVEGKDVGCPFIRDPRVVDQICRAVAELETGELNPIDQKGYIYVILGALLGQLKPGDRHLPQDGDLPTRLLFYINEHYRENLSVESIAQAVGYSANYVSKCFRSCFHIGIGRYLNTVRLKNAAALMREGTGITRSALDSGFSSLRTFYRTFAEEFGCAPRAYLKRD